MTEVPLPVQITAQLMADHGSELNLARRIAELRGARGWSQETLAAAMQKAGCPIPQSAISKIERPGPGGRRAITVDEAIAFAKVFEVSFAELVLPAGAQDSVLLFRLLMVGPNYRRQIEKHQQRYDELLEQLAKIMLEDPRHVAVFRQQASVERERYGDGSDPHRLAFPDDLEAKYRELGGRE